MNTVGKLLTKYNCPKRAAKPTITVELIEKIVNFTLPNDYLIFAQYYSGFEEFIGEEFVRLWDIDELMETNQGYQIFTNLPKTLGIGTNGGGEFIAMEQLDDGKIRMVISPLINLDKESHIEIGKSFTDFLIRLDNGQKWFK